jgi:hypothetical protein
MIFLNEGFSSWRMVAKRNLMQSIPGFAPLGPSPTSPQPSPPLRGGEGGEFTFWDLGLTIGARTHSFSKIYSGNCIIYG